MIKGTGNCFLLAIAIKCGCKGKRCSNRKHPRVLQQTPSSLRVTHQHQLQTQAIRAEQNYAKWSSSTETPVGTDTTTPYSLCAGQRSAWNSSLTCQGNGMIKEPLLFCSNSNQCGCNTNTCTVEAHLDQCRHESGHFILTDWRCRSPEVLS